MLYEEIKHIVKFYLREFHLHVSKDMKESHNSIPQATVSQTFLIPSTGSLEENSFDVSCLCQIQLADNFYALELTLDTKRGTSKLTDLYVLCECVENLFGNSDGFGEVVLPMNIDHTFP